MNGASTVRLSGSLLVTIVLLITQGTAQARSKSGPVGDPGGRILAQLAELKHAVPQPAVDVHALGVEPHLTNSCDTSTPGVQEIIGFDSRQSVATVQKAVARTLRRAGWQHLSSAGPAMWYDEISGHQVQAENYLVRWSRQLPQKTTADATLQVAVPVTGWKPGDYLHWTLGALALGVDEPHRHCGEA